MRGAGGTQARPPWRQAGSGRPALRRVVGAASGRGQAGREAKKGRPRPSPARPASRGSLQSPGAWLEQEPHQRAPGPCPWLAPGAHCSSLLTIPRRGRGEPRGSPRPGPEPAASPPARPAAAHLLCLTCAVSAGKLSPAVCKHRFPLCCSLPSPAASPARRRRTSCLAWHRAPCGLPRSRPAGAVPERPESRSLAIGLPPAPRSSLCGPRGPWDPGESGTPQNTGTLGATTGLWGQLRGFGREQCPWALGTATS